MATHPLSNTYTILNRLSSPTIWIVLTIIVILMDLVSGPSIRFSLFMAIPVSLAAWQGHLKLAVFLGVAAPVLRIFLVGVTDMPWTFGMAASNALICVAALPAIALMAQAAGEKARAVRALRLRVGGPARRH